MKRAIATVIVGAALACGSERSGQELQTPEQYCGAFTDAVGALMVDCADATAAQVAAQRPSIAETCAVMGRSAQAGRVRYEPAAARGCLDRVELGTCDQRLSSFWWPECTRTVFPAMVAIGGSCDQSFECVNGRCTDGAVSLRTCQPWQGVGESCLGPDVPCVDGQMCTFTLSSNGDCAPGLVCVNDLCAEQSPVAP